ADGAPLDDPGLDQLLDDIRQLPALPSDMPGHAVSIYPQLADPSGDALAPVLPARGFAPSIPGFAGLNNEASFASPPGGGLGDGRQLRTPAGGGPRRGPRRGPVPPPPPPPPPPPAPRGPPPPAPLASRAGGAGPGPPGGGSFFPPGKPRRPRQRINAARRR